jgi:hypothetical protein
MSAVKVAVLRGETDRLFRLANSHYHACVGVREVQNWQEIAKRVLEESAQISCKRAGQYDLEQWAKAVQTLADTITASVERLHRLSSEQTRLTQRPALQIVKPAENGSVYFVPESDKQISPLPIFVTRKRLLAV